MANGLTRGERRGLIGLLIVLAVIIAVTAFSGGVKAPPARVVESREAADTVRVVYRHDTTVVKASKRKRKNTWRAVEKRERRQPERSPLDEPVSSK